MDKNSSNTCYRCLVLSHYDTSCLSSFQYTCCKMCFTIAFKDKTFTLHLSLPSLSYQLQLPSFICRWAFGQWPFWLIFFCSPKQFSLFLFIILLFCFLITVWKKIIEEAVQNWPLCGFVAKSLQGDGLCSWHDFPRWTWAAAEGLSLIQHPWNIEQNYRWVHAREAGQCSMKRRVEGKDSRGWIGGALKRGRALIIRLTRSIEG